MEESAYLFQAWRLYRAGVTVSGQNVHGPDVSIRVVPGVLLGVCTRGLS